MSAASEAGLRVLREVADPDVVHWAQALERAGTHRWVFDPSVDHVVGLEVVGSARHVDVGGKAVIIVYETDKDFEVDDEALEAWKETR